MEILGLIAVIFIVFGAAEMLQEYFKKIEYRELPDGTVYRVGHLKMENSVRETLQIPKEDGIS